MAVGANRVGAFPSVGQMGLVLVGKMLLRGHKKLSLVFLVG